MNETEIRNDVAKAAQAWLGAKKGDATHFTIVNLYNSYEPLPTRNGKPYKLTYTDNWCAAFVSAVSIKCGLTDIMPVECSCTNMITLYQKLDRWVERDDYKPDVGDVIFYRWDDGANYKTTDQKGSPNHVGIVVEVNGDAFTVIEGNRTVNGVSQVAYRTMEVNGRYIRGFATPDYAGKATPEHWYDETMAWGHDIGLVSDDRPADYATRAEIVQMFRNFDKYRLGG